MASSSVVRPQIGAECIVWDHKFTWTSDHRSVYEYRPLKRSYDTLGEACLEKLTSLSLKDRDHYTTLRDRHQSDEHLQRFWNEVTSVPDWVDWESVSRGQDVFHRYGTAMLTGLAYQSLFGGTAGSASIAEVLSKTGGFDLARVRKRLLETTQFVLHCTESLEAIRPGGDGFAAAVRVRLLHAMVRKRILNIAASDPSYFSVEKSGTPINDADSIATIAVFSASLVWVSLPRQGLQLRSQEIIDYIALWRLVAFYMGTPTDPFATPAIAKATVESLMLCEYAPSPTSCRLARNILCGLENRPPFYLSRSMLETQCRWLSGNALCDEVGVGRPSWLYWVLCGGQFLIFAKLVSLAHVLPSWDRYMIATSRRMLWSTVLDPRKGGLGALTLFTLQYVPSRLQRTNDENSGGKQSSRIVWTSDGIVLGVLAGIVGAFGVSVCVLLWS